VAPSRSCLLPYFKGTGRGVARWGSCLPSLVTPWVLANTSPAIIYEPFSGSGTAIIAAEQTGRRCRALELAPAFCDVAVGRWEHFSGKQAALEGDGRSFAEVAGGRRRVHEILGMDRSRTDVKQRGYGARLGDRW
jgi:hypothetical protein